MLPSDSLVPHSTLILSHKQVQNPYYSQCLPASVSPVSSAAQAATSNVAVVKTSTTVAGSTSKVAVTTSKATTQAAGTTSKAAVTTSSKVTVASTTAKATVTSVPGYTPASGIYPLSRVANTIATVSPSFVRLTERFLIIVSRPTVVTGPEEPAHSVTTLTPGSTASLSARRSGSAPLAAVLVSRSPARRAALLPWSTTRFVPPTFLLFAKLITNQCPECVNDHLDLDSSYAAQVDVNYQTKGIFDITWEFVPCSVSGNLQFKNKEGTSAYYFALQVRNSVLPIDKLEVSTNGGSTWTNVEREEYNFFTSYS
jgi:hypothetical protein